MSRDIYIEGPSAPPAMNEARTYGITPASVTVQAGMLTGELTALRVTAHPETRVGVVAAPATLAGSLRLTNTSGTQSVRLVAAKIRYLDEHWRPIGLDDFRTEAIFTFTAHRGEWLDPGQAMVQAVDVAFPAEALDATRLKGLRLEIGYVSCPYREEAISIAVSIERQ